MLMYYRLEYTKYNQRFVEMYPTWAAAKNRGEKLKVLIYNIYPVKLYV